MMHKFWDFSAELSYSYWILLGSIMFQLERKNVSTGSIVYFHVCFSNIQKGWDHRNIWLSPQGVLASMLSKEANWK